MVYRFVFSLLFVACVINAPPAIAIQESKTEWGRISQLNENIRKLDVVQRPAQGRLLLPTTTGNVVRATRLPRSYLTLNDSGLDWLIDKDAKQTELLLGNEAITSLQLIAAKQSIVLDDGTIVLTATDASVNGKTAKLESQNANYRIGFWTDPDDSVEWNFDAPRWGKYDVELIYSLAGTDGNQIELTIANATLTAKLNSTGSWYRYTSLPMGRIHLENEGKFATRIKCKTLVSGAVMNLKAILLHPAPEGEDLITPDNESGEIVLHARDATVFGKKLRYEPNPRKITLGYWVNIQDWAAWQMELPKPATFDISILQGCGKGQGGSGVEIVIYPGTRFLSEPTSRTKFTVKDTGHFQNFVARDLGTISFPESGKYIVAVRPIKKAKNAVMDLRSITLSPKR